MLITLISLLECVTHTNCSC